MNRTEEWAALLAEPMKIPPELDETVQRARARRNRARKKRWFAIPAASVAGVAAAFVLAVNLSLPFALACGTVPMLKDLMAAVAFSESLKTAVQNDYVQYSGQSQTKNGVTVTIQYLILDKRQVNVFYTLESEDGYYLQLMPTAVLADGITPADGYAGVWGSDAVNGLWSFSLDFINHPVPETLYLSCEVRAYESSSAEAPVALPPGAEDQPVLAHETFLFQLPLKSEYTDAGETVTVGQWLEVDGQRLYLDTVDIYPTHVQVNFKDDENNTAWLRALYFHLEDEAGNRYEKGGGITALGGDTPFMPSHRLESSYFGSGDHLRLVITGADWLDKEDQWLNGLEVGRTYTEAELPGDLVSLSLERDGDDVDITLLTPHAPDIPHRARLSWNYRDGSGIQGFFQSAGVGSEDEALQYERYRLTDFPDGTVDLELAVTRHTTLADPVTADIR